MLNVSIVQRKEPSPSRVAKRSEGSSAGVEAPPRDLLTYNGKGHAPTRKVTATSWTPKKPGGELWFPELYFVVAALGGITPVSSHRSLEEYLTERDERIWVHG